MVPSAALALIYPGLLLSFAAQKNYTVFPAKDGQLYLVDVYSPTATPIQIEELKDKLSTITFTLYTKKSSRNGQTISADVEELRNSNWDPRLPTRIITHGWKSSGSYASCTDVRDAYLATDNYNIIVMDWREIASNIFYGLVADSVPTLANYLAEFINFLMEHGKLNPSTTKIIGHSLGAHIAGLAARFADGKIAGVVGLDPAGPRFESRGPEYRINATDAEHVQIIHTSSTLGLTAAVGTSDFYPNGGNRQPGCGRDYFSSCAHSRSYLYYAESILRPKGFRAAPLGMSHSGHSEEHVFMGGPTLDPGANGIYTLNTASDPPFALG